MCAWYQYQCIYHGQFSALSETYKGPFKNYVAENYPFASYYLWSKMAFTRGHGAG